MTAATFTLLGWEISWFTAKTRSYLLYKQVPFVERAVDLPTLMIRIPRRTGAVVMPVVVTPEGDWLQDSSVIIDRLEERFPSRPVLPATPVHRMLSYALEAWGDEFWIPAAMHTRWSHPENQPLFEREAGEGLLPHAPAFLQRRAARFPMNMMRRHLPGLGVEPSQHAVLDAWLATTLDALDRHFAQHAFLLGGRPTLGDFSLAGPLCAHVGRDPWSKRELVDPRPHLAAWVERMRSPAGHAGGELVAGDGVPPTLVPLLEALFRELTPLLGTLLSRVQEMLPTLAAGALLPRGIQGLEFPLGEGKFRGIGMPYTLWMLQRLQDAFRRLDPAAQASARETLRGLGGERWLDFEVPRLRRHGLRVGPEVA